MMPAQPPPQRQQPPFQRQPERVVGRGRDRPGHLHRHRPRLRERACLDELPGGVRLAEQQPRDGLQLPVRGQAAGQALVEQGQRQGGGGRLGLGDAGLLHGRLGVDEPQEAEQAVAVPDRDADARQQPQVRRPGDAQGPDGLVDARVAQPSAYLGRGAAAQDRVAAYVVHGAALLAVDHDLLDAVLKEQGAVETGGELVHDPLEIRHSATFTWIFRQLTVTGLQVFPTTAR